MQYRCPCGHEADEVPSAPGREIVSVYHIHRADVRGLVELVRMMLVEFPMERRGRGAEPVGAALR